MPLLIAFLSVISLSVFVSLTLDIAGSMTPSSMASCIESNFPVAGFLSLLVLASINPATTKSLSVTPGILEATR